MFRHDEIHATAKDLLGNELKQDHDLAKVGVEGSNPFARSKT